MPGIAGVIAIGDRAATAARLASAMHAETFYVDGTIEDAGCAVTVAWTAHAGSQAHRVCEYRHGDGSRLVLAGECFDAGGASLMLAPHVLAASTIEGCRRNGPRHLEALNGLFAGALLDAVTGRVTLFTDRYGIERLHLHVRDDVVLFASEAKAIVAAAEHTRALDESAVAEFLKFGSVLGERTLFRGVTRLERGSAWCFERGRMGSRVRWFDPSCWATPDDVTEDEVSQALAEALRARVPAYFVAERPVGMSITGGLDTRMIMACVGASERPSSCYTFVGERGITRDAAIGAQVAAVSGVPHSVLRLGPDFVAHFGDYVDRTVRITDGCAGATTAHEIYFTALARQLAPVRVTGNFGSEVLRSMPTFKAQVPPEGLLAPSFRPVFEAAHVDAGPANPVVRAAFVEIPTHLYGSLAAGRSQLTFRTPYLDNAIVRLACGSPGAARASPAPSLRVIEALAPSMARLPTDRGVRADDSPWRGALRRGAETLLFKADWLDKEGLPGWLRHADPALRALRHTPLLGRHKFLPYRTWFRRELADYVADVVTDPRVTRLGIWQPRSVAALAADHRSGRRNSLRELSAIITLEAVDRLLLAPSSASPPRS